MGKTRNHRGWAIAIGSVATCALAAAVWLIPQSAKADIASQIGKEYVESGIGATLVHVRSSGAIAARNATTTLERKQASTLTDAQNKAFEALARKEIQERLGVAVPAGLEADITATEDASGNATVTVFLTNGSQGGSSGISATYAATFENANLNAGTGSMSSVMRRGDIRESEVSAYADKARKAFADELGLELPKGYPLDASLTVEAGYTSAKLRLQWYSSDPSMYIQDPLSGEQVRAFTAGFENVDLRSGAGSLMQLERFISYEGDSAATANFTDAQDAAMEEAARAFARGKGIELGAATSRTKVSGGYRPGMQYTFACPGREAMTITVAQDGSIQGYGFYMPKG